MIRPLLLCAAVILGAALGAVGQARADFVTNNLRFTLYHEFGHAVIDQLALPVFGPQENAADSFAMVLAGRLHSEAEMAGIMTDTTNLARQEAEQDFFDPWDEYMPAAQRLARAICLYYGLRPDQRLETARVLGLPSSSKRDCVEDARTTKAAWNAVFDRMAPSGETSAALRPARQGKALRLLARDIEKINRMIALPRPVRVIQTPCGEDNAFYFDVDERIEFCSEMIEALRARARR